MKLIKTAVVLGAAAMAISIAAPVEANRDSSGQGYGDISSNHTPATHILPGRAKATFSTNASASIGNSNGGTSVPEPSNLLMLGLGVVGLIAGRLVARRRK